MTMMEKMKRWEKNVRTVVSRLILAASCSDAGRLGAEDCDGGNR
jgi:hypothetical protein